MPRNKKPRKPVQLELQLPPGETEITIGGEEFSVKVRSAAALGDVIRHGLDVYRACAPQEVRKPPMGFAGPGAGSAEISGPVGQSLYPLDLD